MLGARKNLKKRVVEKMRAFKKGAMAISLSGMLIFGVSGCAGTLDNNNTSPPPEPTDTPTSQPIEQELGDVIIATDKDGNPIIITDEYGSYAKTTISPDADSMKLDKSKWEDTVATSGLTDDEVLSAQQWVATFIAEQGTDSIALDGTTGWEKWKANESSKYADPNLVDPNFVASGSDRSTIISNNAYDAVPLFIRDGQSRIATSDITVEGLWSKAYDGVANLFFNGSSTQQYRVTDDSMVEAIIRSNPGATKESVLAESPQYADGKDGTFGLTLTWRYGVEKTTTGWTITGYDNQLNNAA